jgi:hypothetical protein
MSKPTFQDASLMMHLAEWQTDCGLHSALSWLWSDAFECDYAAFASHYPAGSDGALSVSLICTYFDTVGTLHRHGFVNEDLLFDWLEIGAIWDRVKPYVLGRRMQAKSPALCSNFESLATAYKRTTREYST